MEDPETDRVMILLGGALVDLAVLDVVVNSGALGLVNGVGPAPIFSGPDIDGAIYVELLILPCSSRRG